MTFSAGNSNDVSPWSVASEVERSATDLSGQRTIDGDTVQ